jgi:hypothetical protein
MHTIYKYVLGSTYTSVPAGDILRVEEQNGIPCAWVLHDLDIYLNESMTLQIFATGEQFDLQDLKHVGTTVGPDFVFHVFKRLN